MRESRDILTLEVGVNFRRDGVARGVTKQGFLVGLVNCGPEFGGMLMGSLAVGLRVIQV